jgi:sugar phosphate isomerase/epimerase
MPRPYTLFTGQWADLPFEEVAKLASGRGYDGLEIAGMDRLHGAPEALAALKKFDFPASNASFDAAFSANG